ncbi:MAG: DUF748 domain-containing protein [Desulfuromonadales bacterium]
MSRKKIILATCLCLSAASLIFIVAILPLIVRDRAVAAIEKELGRTAQIESVSINPFTLSIAVSGMTIKGTDGGKFISLGNLRASLGLASAYRRAVILSRVTVDAPSISFARRASNSYDFEDIVARLKAKPKSKSETHFSINNISITNGSLDFDDRAVPGGRTHTVRNFNAAVPFISNIPYLVEKYTDPHISAVVNGAPFKFSGKIKPLSSSMETSVHVDLSQLSLPEYVAYLPTRPPADITSGSLSIDSDITYRIHADKKPQLHIKGMARLENCVVNLRNGKPLISIPLFETRASLLELLAGRFAFESIRLDGLELFASRTGDGEWMFNRLLQPSTEEKQQDTSAPANPPNGGTLSIKVTDFSFSNGTIHFSDALPSGGFKSEVRQIDASIRNFSTSAGSSAEYELSLLMDNETDFSADGSFSLIPLKVSLSSELSGMKLQRAWPYLSQFLTAPLKGTVELSSEINYSTESGLTVEQGKLLLTGFSTRYGDREGFDLARLEVNDAGYRQKENLVEAGELKLSKGNLSLSREADGRISILSLIRPAPSKTKSAAQQLPATAETTAVPKPVDVAAQKQAAAQALSFRLKKFQLEKFNAEFTDKTFEEKPRFTFSNTTLSLFDLNGPKFTPAGVNFSSTFNRATPLKAKGQITPLPFRYRGSLTASRLPLRDFDPYFPSNVNVFVVGGLADADMNVDIALTNGKPSGSFKGNAGIRSFHAIDTAAEEDLLKWESLQLDDIRGSLEPFSLTLRQVALNGVYSRIAIRTDGTLNLQNLVESPKRIDASAAVPQPSAVTTPPAGSPGMPLQPTVARTPVKIDAVTIQDGTLSFTDNHLPQQFATTFYNLGGRVSGLSSEEAKFADVDLRGNLDNHSPLQITGRVNPLRGDLFVDLKISFRDIELSPVTPYSSRFLGYAVEKGKLFLDLNYRIDKKQLNSENRVFIDQFTFGEKVESDKATTLPVKLGLALLKDRRGEIHLDLPVTGRTDDPRFSIWGVVWQVVKNLLVKAVTSPFALLSSMAGGGQDFSAIQFDTGTSAFSPSEERKLTSLAKLLADRPALKMELKGYVDRDRDTEGYRNELLNRKLRHEKFLALSKDGNLKEGSSEDSITLLPGEQDTFLAAVYRKEKFPKPRNMIGLVKELPPGEMKKLIITNTPVGETELQLLAHERIAAVKNYLITSGGVPAERIFEKKDNLFKAPEKETVSRSRVELNAIAQ